MARKPVIPHEVKTEVENTVAEFNRKTFRNSGIAYSARYRGEHLYLKQ